MFRFPNKIHRESFKTNDLNQTITSNDIARKDSLLDSTRIERNRSTTISPKLKFNGLKRSTLERKTSNVSSALLSPTRHRISPGKNVWQPDLAEDVEIERKNVMKPKKKEEPLPYMAKKKHLVNLETGRPKGLALLKEIAWEKVAERKIKKIIEAL